CGPLNIGISVHGEVARGRALRRSGARPGDLLCVGGPLGDAAAGLALVLDQPLPAPLDEASRDYLLARFWRPRAQCELGQALQGRGACGGAAGWGGRAAGGGGGTWGGGGGGGGGRGGCGGGGPGRGGWAGDSGAGAEGGRRGAGPPVRGAGVLGVDGLVL